ncbi:type IV pili methyl-accepting chemotaxis transducer N-terminal domain-containing protein [Thiolapillus sp.]
MKSQKLLLLLICSLPLLFAGAIEAAPETTSNLTMGDAINKAGRQRMLSQRIVKAYALVGQKVMLSANMQLRDAVVLFEKQLAELTDFAATDEEKKTIEEVSRLWEKYKKLATAKPTKAKAEQLTAMSDEVLAKAHKFVLLLQDRSGTNAGKLVNISGRQRMLSQRIGKFYVLRSWGLDNPEYELGQNKAVEEFTDALKLLQSAPENTSEINDALAKVEKDWDTFKISKQLKGGNYIPSLVVRSLDKILGQMNYITALYANIAR